MDKSQTTFALLMLSAAGLQAAGIALNFSENDSNQSWLNTTDLIGPTNIPAGFFNTNNNPTGAAGLPARSGTLAAGSLLGLVDSTGAVTAASVTWSSNNAYYNSSGTATNQARLAVGYLDDGGANGASVTFSALPYAVYDVYILLGSDAGNTHNSEVPRVNGVNVLAADFPAFGNLTGSGGGWIEADGVTRGNYVVARGITGSSVTIAGQNVTTNRIGISGIVISEVPEPSAALLGLGTLAGLALRRRR
jgi:hypothetical protein